MAADVVDVSKHPCETVIRLGLRRHDGNGSSSTADSPLGRALLVGWSRRAFADTTARPPAAPETPPAGATRTGTPRSDASPPDRRHDGETSPSSTDLTTTAVDRWAIVTILPPGETLEPAETAMLDRLRNSVAGELAEPPETADRPHGRILRPLLSPRERECLQWTAAGKTTWEIAAILCISQNTVDGYIASATRKLGAVNRTQAVAVALRRGQID